MLGPGAQNRPPADNGQTPGGLEGTLAHEAEHGETMAEAFRAALDGQHWNGIPWGIKSVLDDMMSKRYKTRKEAIVAKLNFQKRLDETIERLIRASGVQHSSASATPNANSAPRDDTAEPLDNPDQQKVNDQKKKKDGIKEMKNLTKKHGYKSYVKPGHFGNYP